MCISAPHTQGPCGYPPQTRLHTFCSLGPLHNKTLWCLHSCKGLWVTSGWKSNGQGAPVLTPAGQHRSSRHTLMSPCELPLPLQHFRPGPQVINRIPGEADVKLFEAQSNYFVHRALPPWGDSRMSQMRTRPSSEELAKMLSFTGLTDKPYTASSWANTSKVSLLREREQREAHRHTHLHKNSAESQSSNS